MMVHGVNSEGVRPLLPDPPLADEVHVVAVHSSIHREPAQVAGMALLELAKHKRVHNGRPG